MKRSTQPLLAALLMVLSHTALGSLEVGPGDAWHCSSERGLVKKVRADLWVREEAQGVRIKFGQGFKSNCVFAEDDGTYKCGSVHFQLLGKNQAIFKHHLDSKAPKFGQLRCSKIP